MSRRRLFSKENTFWAFFGQVLDADGGCKEVVRKLQSYASIKGIKIPSSSTASYCTARKKLDEEMLFDIFKHTADWCDKIPETGLLNNRRVIVVDGRESVCRIRQKTRIFGRNQLHRSRDVDFHQHGFALFFLWKAERCSAMLLATEEQ